MSRRLVTAPRLFAAGAVVLAGLGAAVLGPFADDAPAKVLEVAATPSASAVSGVIAERQSGVLSDEDQRLLTLVATVRPGSAPYLQDLDGRRTLVLTAGGPSYGLSDLIDYGAAQVQADGSVLGTQHVFVAPGARLAITAPGDTIRLASGRSGFASVVAWKADLVLAGEPGQRLTVTSWDNGGPGPDESVIDGRAYIRDVSGDMELRYTDVSDLGFWAGRTSGVAWT